MAFNVIKWTTLRSLVFPSHNLLVFSMAIGVTVATPLQQHMLFVRTRIELKEMIPIFVAIFIVADKVFCSVVKLPKCIIIFIRQVNIKIIFRIINKIYIFVIPVDPPSVAPPGRRRFGGSNA